MVLSSAMYYHEVVKEIATQNHDVEIRAEGKESRYPRRSSAFPQRSRGKRV